MPGENKHFLMTYSHKLKPTQSWEDIHSNNKVTDMSAPVHFVMAIPYILMHHFLKKIINLACTLNIQIVYHSGGLVRDLLRIIIIRNSWGPASYSGSGYQGPLLIPKYVWINRAAKWRTRKRKVPIFTSK